MSAGPGSRPLPTPPWTSSTRPPRRSSTGSPRGTRPTWAPTSPGERAGLLDAVRVLLAARADDVAGTIATDMGCPLAFARKVQVDLPLAVLASYVELLSYYEFVGERTGNSLIVREPSGVAGLITPWNYPLHQIVAKAAAALAAGCTTVLKPS